MSCRKFSTVLELFKIKKERIEKNLADYFTVSNLFVVVVVVVVVVLCCSIQQSNGKNKIVTVKW